MKILQIFSNWKWTGPAEHALNLAINQQKAGHEVTFACAAPPPDQKESLLVCARERGVEPETGFRLNKHFCLTDNLLDIPRMRSYLKREKFDVVHTHMPNDHFVAGMALRSSLTRTALMRTCYDGEGVPRGPRSRTNFSLMTDGLITVSEQTRRLILSRRYIGEQKVWKVDVPVDIGRFNPETVVDNRAGLNLAPEAIVGGIVARVQTHRRFEVLLEALQMVISDFPGFRFMIIGRGTHIQEIAVKPSQQMGIRTNLIFTGYKKEGFVSTLKCLSFKVFLVPGSDGACRAVREAMALGIPIIASRRGILPELVENGKEGLIIDDTPENLRKAIMLLVEHPELRRELAQNALKKARQCFDPEVQTKLIEEIYEKVISRRFKKK
ncbi:MAG: glycosyltransferase family 4 protein [Deltaproteobacteria bacterium]|nr:glycosyltransferase family 4 protein [Deltaproteobacteria bacterium]